MRVKLHLTEKKIKTSGFTLVELSVVLIIIGLLIGGIVSAVNMVQQAKLNAVITESRNYRLAVESFKGYYNYYPGDMSNAFAFWGNDCAITEGLCNGNGNGAINYDRGDGASDAPNRQEAFMAWRHMGLAKVIPGSYSGNSTLFNFAIDPGVNAPVSKYSGGIWFIGTMSYDNFIPEFDTSLTRRVALMIGSKRPDSIVEYPLFSPSDAYFIDRKIDDGAPYTGEVVGVPGDGIATTCVTGSGATTEYTLSATGPQCWMWFTIKKL
jgi:prepilin-type N-terminal cleavage/methylation domain-containing protein